MGDALYFSLYYNKIYKSQHSQTSAHEDCKVKNGDVLVGSRLVRRCGVPHVAARRSATYLQLCNPPVPSPSEMSFQTRVRERAYMSNVVPDQFGIRSNHFIHVSKLEHFFLDIRFRSW